jgi:RES domain-containing protein
VSGGPLTRRFADTVYRAHNPRWAYAPTSGTGAARHGGRFNPPGTPALYTSLDLKTAWMEAQQGFPFKPQPMTLVAYEIDCDRVTDLSDMRVIAELGVSPATLACPWEELASQKAVPPSWELAQRLIDEEVTGILVRSFAPGCGPEDINLVLWGWSDRPPCLVREIDDHGRLPRNDGSWR